MLQKKRFLSVVGVIRAEHRSGEVQTWNTILGGMGSVVEVYQAGALKADASYTADGDMLSASWNMSSYSFRWRGGWGYRYTGKDWMNTYVRARHYSTSDGAWSTVDPLWPNEVAYRYVEGRMMGAVDPSGMQLIDLNCGRKRDFESVCKLLKRCDDSSDCFDALNECMQREGKNRINYPKSFLKQIINKMNAVCTSGPAVPNVCFSCLEKLPQNANEACKEACNDKRTTAVVVRTLRKDSEFGVKIESFKDSDGSWIGSCLGETTHRPCRAKLMSNAVDSGIRCDSVVLLCRGRGMETLFHELIHVVGIAGSNKHGKGGSESDFVEQLGKCRFNQSKRR